MSHLFFFLSLIESGRNSFVLKDSHGVERSNNSFKQPPELDLDIRRDLLSHNSNLNFVQRAMRMLADDVKNNPLLLQAWHQGMTEKPEFSSV